MIIGLSGRAGSGKDTVYSILAGLYGSGCESVSFATPIKEAAKLMFRPLGLTDWHVDGPSEARSASIRGFAQQVGIQMDARHILQTLGTEWGRYCIHPDIWVALGLIKARELEAMGRHVVVITDVRFENEMKAIRESGGELWHITRPAGSKLKGKAAVHASERDLVRPAWWKRAFLGKQWALETLHTDKILNNSTLEELNFTVQLACERAIKRAEL